MWLPRPPGIVAPDRCTLASGTAWVNVPRRFGGVEVQNDEARRPPFLRL
jgi:hypothetical protein